MIGFLIGLLTVVLVLDCLLLILLVLIQLPKKEAGMGQAFGGGATDALFGAGSGNALTKLTKYGTGAFFVVAILISVLNGYKARSSGDVLKKILEAEGKKPVAPAPATPKTPEPGTPVPALTNLTFGQATTNVVVPPTTNVVIPVATNKPATPK